MIMSHESKSENVTMPEGAPAVLDVAVLLVFFIRPQCLKKVFERVREVRPKELFLYQDGPRDNHPEDLSKMLECREIVSHIDWDCQVHCLYQQENSGADEAGYLASSWAFSLTERCIVLEDDVVPSPSFFRFCADVLKRYADDERVCLVSSQNLEGETCDVDTDYFFSPATYTWGWASWARVVRQWDPAMGFLSDPEQNKTAEQFLRRSGIRPSVLKHLRQQVEQGKRSWEAILLANQYRLQGLSIVPRCNMSQNIGMDADAAHYSQDLSLMAKGDRFLFEMPAYDIDVDNLRHPSEILPHDLYLKRAYRLRALAIHYPLVRCYRIMESMFYMVRAGRAKEAFCRFLARLKRMILNQSFY